jgi:hypothetical protein
MDKEFKHSMKKIYKWQAHEKIPNIINH